MIIVKDYEVKPTIFPDGTSQVWQLPAELLLDLTLNEHVFVEWIFQNEAELMHVCQLAALIRVYMKNPDAKIHLQTKYLPYARQDKNVRNDSCFALSVFKKIICAYYNTVISIDPHSNNYFDFTQSSAGHLNKIFRELISLYDYVVFPDRGAWLRYNAMIKQFSNKIAFSFQKERDGKTGKILSITAPKTIGDIKGKSCVIIDDICDGGGTFCGVAKELNRNAASQIGLYCSHLILSAGTEPLFNAGISKIYDHRGLAFSAHGEGHGKIFNER